MKGISNNLASASVGDNRYKTPLGNKQKAEYPTIQDCIDSIAENVDSKFFDKNKITTTVLQKTKSTYQELDKNQEDISKYKEQLRDWKKLSASTSHLYNTMQELRESQHSNQESIFGAKTITGKDIEQYADVSVKNGFSIQQLPLQIKQLASEHQIRSKSFKSMEESIVQANNTDKNSAIFTPGTFKIGIPNFPLLSATFESKKTNITDPSTPHHLKIGSFSIDIKESEKVQVYTKENDTLETLKDRINNASNRIKASIISENDGFRLLIQSKYPGPLNRYEIIDKDNILNGQFKIDDSIDGYKSFVSIKLTEGESARSVIYNINYHTDVTGVSAIDHKIDDDEYKIFLKNDYTGAETIVDLSDESGCLGDTFSRNFEFNGSITSSVGFESEDSPVVYEYHQKPDAFTAGYITINEKKILLEKGDTLTKVAEKINSESNATNVTAEITKNQGGDNKFRISLTYTGTAPEKVIKIKDYYMSLNSVFPSVDSASDTKYITSEATMNHSANAIIELNKQLIQRTHNTINDIYSKNSLTITLKKTTESHIDLFVTPDQKQIFDSIIKFLDTYDELLLQICKYTYDDLSQEATGSLVNDREVKRISNDLSIPPRTRAMLDSIGIFFAYRPEQTNAHEEFQPKCECIDIRKQDLQKAINNDIKKVEELFAFILKSNSENFFAPIADVRKNVDFGSLIVDSIDYEVDFNKLEVISSQSKFVESKDTPVANKSGNIIINNRNIKLLEGDSLQTLANKINKAFPKNSQIRDKNNKAQAEIEAKIIGSDGYNAILLEINQHQDLEIVDYDNILGDLFKAELPSFESILFDDENAAAVNKPAEHNLNLLKEGTFNINNKEIQVSQGDTWKDIVQKINNLNINGITAEIVPNAHRYQLKIQQLDKLDTKLRIHDYREVTKGVIHAANTTKLPLFQSTLFDDKNSIAVKKPKENYPDLFKEGTFNINDKNIRVSQGDTWQDIAQKINNLNLTGIAAEIVQSANKYRLKILQTHNLAPKLTIHDPQKVTQGVITVVADVNDDKAKLFFDTTRVATAKVNTAKDVIQKNTLFKIPYLQSRPDKQLAMIDIFNPANQPQNHIQCQVSYINFAEQLHSANDAKSHRKIKDHANVKIQQGIIDKIAVKIKDYNLQFIAQDNIISNKIQQLQKKISESEAKQQKLEKEADKKCKEVMVYIKQQETTYEMNKKMTQKLWGNSKNEL